MSELATAGLDTIAVRVPDHPVAQRHSRGVRQAGRRAVGQSLRPCVADRPPRMCWPTSTGRIDLIVDGGPTRGRRRIDDRGLPRRSRACCVPAASRASRYRERARRAARGAIGRDRGRERRSRRGNWRRTTRRARGCASTPGRQRPARRCLRSAPGCPKEPRAPWRSSASRQRAISSKRPPICSRICARSMPPELIRIAVMPIPHEVSAKRSTTVCAARRRRGALAGNLAVVVMTSLAS